MLVGRTIVGISYSCAPIKGVCPSMVASTSLAAANTKAISSSTKNIKHFFIILVVVVRRLIDNPKILGESVAALSGCMDGSKSCTDGFPALGRFKM